MPERDRTPAEDEIDLIDIVAVIWRYRVVIVLVTLLAVAGGGVSVFVGGSDAAPESASEEGGAAEGEAAEGAGEGGTTAGSATRYTSERLLYFDPIARDPSGADSEPLTGNYRRVSQRILDGIVERAGSGEPVEGLDEDLLSAVAGATVEPDEEDRYLLAISATVADRRRSTAAVESLINLLTAQLEQAGLTRADGGRAFEVIESPVTVTERDSENGTQPAVILVVAGFAGLFFGVFLAFVLNYIDKVRKDPEAMRKLKGADRG